MKLLAVVYRIGESRMEVVVDDDAGMRRRVNLTWHSLTPKIRPPANWLASVEGEVRYQQGQGRNPFARFLGR